MAKYLMNPSFSSLKYPEFRIYLIARFIFIMVLTMQATLISWKIFEITKDPFSIGLIGLVEFVPAVIMAFYAGYVIDRSDRKKLFHYSIGANLILTILFAYVTSQHAYNHLNQSNILMSMYGIVFCTGIARAFSGPSSFALVSSLVPKEEIPNAITWHSGSWQIAAVGGPAIGGLLYAATGITFTFMLIILLLLVSITILFYVSPKSPPELIEKESMLKSIREGFKFVWKTKEILGVLSLDLFAVFFGGATAMLPYFTDVILKTGAQGLGLLRSAPAVGAITLMLLIHFIPLKKNQGKIMIWCVGGFGLSIILFGLSNMFWISALALFVSGFLDGISILIRSTILQLKTPEEMRGRVSSLNSIFIMSSNELGAFESGVMSKLIGVIPSVIVGGGMTMAIAGLTWFKLPAVKKIEY
jgi:MFS family permease